MNIAIKTRNFFLTEFKQAHHYIYATALEHCAVCIIWSVIYNEYNTIYQLRWLQLSCWLHKHFQLITDVNSDRFNLISSATCLLDQAFAQLLLTPKQAPLLHADKLMVISVYGNSPVDPTTLGQLDLRSKDKDL